MTIVNKFLRELALIARDEKGFYMHQYAAAWLQRVHRAAVRKEYPYGDSSVDSSEELFFNDGSGLYVGNPRQEVYPIHSYLIEG